MPRSENWFRVAIWIILVLLMLTIWGYVIPKKIYLHDQWHTFLLPIALGVIYIVVVVRLQKHLWREGDGEEERSSSEYLD